MKYRLALGVIASFFTLSCATPLPADRAPDPGTILALKLLAAKSVESRLKIGIEARLHLGLGFGYAAALREKGETRVFAIGKKTFGPVKLLTTKDSLALGSLSKVFTGILVNLAVIEGKLRLDEVGPHASDVEYLALRNLLEKTYSLPYAELLNSRVLRPLRIELGKKSRKVVPGYSLNSELVVNGAVTDSASAQEMAKFLEALETPPAGKLGQAITASMETAFGWDSLPGANFVWKNGATASHSTILAYDRETKRAVFIGTNSLARPDDLAFAALGSASLDRLVSLATPKRAVSEEENTRLRGRFQNPNLTVEISEVLGRLSIRYQQTGGLLIPDDDSNHFSVIDGTHNLDKVRLLSDGVRITLGGGEKPLSFECSKIETRPEQYPAQE